MCYTGYKYLMDYLLASLLISTNVMIQRPVACVPVVQGMKTLVEEYQETVYWHSARDSGITAALTVNATTGTWSFVEFNQDLMCIISAGAGAARQPVDLR